MRITIKTLRSIIREALDQQAWVPGRYYPANEPLSSVDANRLNQPQGEELTIDEVDLDPSNNPGRPADAYDYIGMHPSPTAAMSHPAASGGGAATATGDAGDTTGVVPEEPSEQGF